MSTSLRLILRPDEEPSGTVWCTLDAEPEVDCSSGTFARSGLTEGSHTLTVDATDDLGNESGSTLNWAVDLTGPDMYISGIPAITKNHAMTVFLSSSEPLMPITGSACALDGLNYLQAQCRGVFRITGLADGVHTFALAGEDVAGNVSPPVSETFTVDSVAPLTTITSAPSDPSAQRSATFTFVADEATSAFQCSLDGAPNARCGAGQARYFNLSTGSHTFNVRAKDLALNVGPYQSYTWTITGSADALRPGPSMRV